MQPVVKMRRVREIESALYLSLSLCHTLPIQKGHSSKIHWFQLGAESENDETDEEEDEDDEPEGQVDEEGCLFVCLNTIPPCNVIFENE